MISVNSNQVIFSHPNIVKYFTKYYKNQPFLESCETLVDTFCKSSDDFILQYATEQKHDFQTNQIMLQLESLEKKNDEFRSSINHIADDILSKVQTQLSSLILSIDNIISSSVSNFNTDSLKEFIAKSFHDTNLQSKNQLEEHLKTHIIAPIHETQQRLLEQFSKFPDLITKSSNATAIEDQLHSMNTKWLSVIDSVILDIKQMDKNLDSYIKVSNDSTHNSPLVIKGVLCDLIHNLEQQNSAISTAVGTIQKDITCNTTNITLIRSANDDLRNRLESLDKQLLAKNTKESNSNSYKGAVAEDTLFNLLSEKLMNRNGFNVTKVNGKSHSCDILIQRQDFPDIRVESKAHGQHTGERIRTKEVEKFERDLLELGDHGIFVSIYSDITAKGSIEITQLPNAKFAIYLSKNMYDCDMINDMVYLIYKLDDIITTSSANANITLSPEIILKIQNTITSFTSKLNTVTKSLKESVSILSTINLEQIEMILLDQLRQNSLPPIETQCACGFVARNAKGLVSHQRKCLKQKPS